MNWNKLWAMNKVHTAIKDSKMLINGNNFHSLVSALELIKCSNIFVLFFCVAMFSVVQMSFGRRSDFVLLLKIGSRLIKVLKLMFLI